jgi:hypothetical protein
MKLRIFVAAGLLMVAGVSCSVKDQIDTSRGRGDAPVGNVDNTPKEVIQFPDRFSNVSEACDGHGNRIFVTTKSDNSRFMAVVKDDSCLGNH